MLTILSVIFVGISAGVVHVLTGPDHLAAVAPLAIGQGRGARWFAGVRWGLGHSGGVAFVAALTWLLRDILPVESFSSFSERLVGVMLLAIGFWSLRKTLKLEIHFHNHIHSSEKHGHLHAHRSPSAVHHHRYHAEASHIHPHAPLFVGILHGFAGASHFLGVLPALAMPTVSLAAIYLVAFALGTIAAMAGFSGLVGYLGERASVSGPRVIRVLMGSCSLAAIAVGVFWIAA